MGAVKGKATRRITAKVFCSGPGGKKRPQKPGPQGLLWLASRPTFGGHLKTG